MLYANDLAFKTHKPPTTENLVEKYLVTNQVCYDSIVTFDCAYVYFRYLFVGFESKVVGI